jgi:hypothetical protein
MKKELDEALCRDFPNLYRDRNGNMQDTCMCWGFPGDGWEPLIRALSEKLEPLGVVATQVKEKFGTLRYYADVPETCDYNATYMLIDESERASASICEQCGQPGTLRKGNWWRTACDECEKKR